ncbi:AtpZ/AtpI family protein [Dyadobacter sp. CY326]|uniref:AtpZ/AtpI family protein n=1 Tax=Dyadobacter sp. CY326 TaxID=2907300 RepID=UPI001F42038A|nr:AtpZ/AtpI family protein [Dyadobacter sp. CY326]MCE7066856.1 AtpZ/AtpI family protein [Dyadobacter sp. CY326]
MKTDNDQAGKDERKRALQKQSSGFLKYSGMATQMLGTILIFTYGGYKLDEWQQNNVPVWTLIMSLLSIAGSLYMLIRGFTKK